MTYSSCDSHDKSDLILPVLQLVRTGKVWLLWSVSEGISNSAKGHSVFHQVFSTHSNSIGGVFQWVNWTQYSFSLIYCPLCEISLEPVPVTLSPVCCALLELCEGILSVRFTACWELTIKKSFHAVVWSLEHFHHLWNDLKYEKMAKNAFLT